MLFVYWQLLCSWIQPVLVVVADVVALTMVIHLTAVLIMVVATVVDVIMAVATVVDVIMVVVATVVDVVIAAVVMVAGNHQVNKKSPCRLTGVFSCLTKSKKLFKILLSSLPAFNSQNFMLNLYFLILMKYWKLSQYWIKLGT